MRKAAERWILFLSLIVNTQSASPGKWIASYLYLAQGYSRVCGFLDLVFLV